MGKILLCFVSLILISLPYSYAADCSIGAPPISGASWIITRFTSPLTQSAHFSKRNEFEPDKNLWAQREDLLTGIEHSLVYLHSARADADYAVLENEALSLEVVTKSLERFRRLLLQSRSSAELECRIQKEFIPFRSAGDRGKGLVKFTGYFQPVYEASRVQTPAYQFPIYRKPHDFEEWSKPHPTRVALEGFEGKGDPGSALFGYELAWFKTRYEAFMVGVQGSAILHLTDGNEVGVGFDAGLEHPFVGVSLRLLKEHKVSYSDLKTFFQKRPDVLNDYLSRNNRLILFKENPLSLPVGSLVMPVIPERSIATDKRKMPPGALALISAKLPERDTAGDIQLTRSSRIVVDHDTGSAIKGSGRVDVFMGTGPVAQQKAVHLYSTGELYYLVLKSAL